MRIGTKVPSLAACVFLAGLFHVDPTFSESDPSVQSWRIIQPAPSKPVQTYRARRRYDTPRSRFPDDSTLGLNMPEITVAMPALPDASRTKIALVGDSLAEALAFGMEADPGMKASLLIRQKTVSASGLIREDYFDWPKTIAAMTAENPDLAALVVMIGLNDRQALRADNTTMEPLSDPWRDAYRKRVDAVILAAQTARIPLIWVGIPVMRSSKLSTELAVLSEMIRERVTASGETYVDIIDTFADQAGNFALSGPDIIGDIVRLRGPDGIHFTPAGQRKLAFFVDKPLRKRIGERAAPENNNPIASLPVSLPIAPPVPGNEISIPVSLPAAIVIPKQRAEIGEIRPLVPVNTASSLIGRQTAPLNDPATRALFDRGLSPEPRSGRSDDYRWK